MLGSDARHRRDVAFGCRSVAHLQGAVDTAEVRADERGGVPRRCGDSDVLLEKGLSLGMIVGGLDNPVEQVQRFEQRLGVTDPPRHRHGLAAGWNRLVDRVGQHRAIQHLGAVCQRTRPHYTVLATQPRDV